MQCALGMTLLSAPLVYVPSRHSHTTPYTPQAKVVMEEKLEKFLVRYSDTYLRLSDGTLSFIKSQVLKHAEDLLKASKANTLDSSNFVNLSASMEKLLQKVSPCTLCNYTYMRVSPTGAYIVYTLALNLWVLSPWMPKWV